MANKDQYIVSARKYRPATFRSVVGQRALTATLKNAIAGGKLAQAYLFCGPRGVGKTSCARIFAKTINCLNPTSDGEACGECESCKAIERGNSFNLVELDAASNNSVENIRNITEQVNIPAQNGRYRVFIIDEVHMLSNSAFNAFLKTLEEPPKNVVFILATTERHKVIPTILSRCQIYDFRRITVTDIIDHLQYVAEQEGIKADREALGVIALKSDGAMRDALSIFDQVAASTHGNVTYEGTIESLNVLDQDYYFRLVDIFRRGEVAEALLTLKEITDKGFDLQFFINGLADHIRNLMVCADPRTVSLLSTSEEWAKRYNEQAPQLPVEWYYAAIRILNDTDVNYRTSSNKRLLAELALIRLSRLLSTPQPTVSKVPSPGPSAQKNVTPAPSQPQQPKESSGPFEAPDGSKPQPAPALREEASQRIQSGPRKLHPDRPKSFRLSSETGKNGIKIEEGPKNNPFNEIQFKEAWEGYIVSHPEQRILVAAMRGATPEKIDSTIYRVKVDHPAQKQAYETSMSEVLDYLKQTLGNDFIRLEVEEPKKESTDQGINPRDFLKIVVEENADLAKFLKDIEAELE
ncbi:MAG: DNA polymerase III subunit gamma/tau [Muribaculaceae bacterium]|nr:DNA polymerase III subunit gamma/tau [Muribaculaceae bacterium]